MDNRGNAMDQRFCDLYTHGRLTFDVATRVKMDIEVSYEFNNMIYKVVGSKELHDQLQNDYAFFEYFITSNAATLEKEAPDDVPQGRAAPQSPPSGAANGDNKQKGATGRGHMTWEYFEAKEKIFQDDKTINIGHTISSFPYTSPCTSASTSSTKSASVSAAINMPTLIDTELQLSPVGDLVSPLCEVNIESVTNNTEGQTPSPNVSVPSCTLSATVESTETPVSKRNKQTVERGKQLYSLRKKQIEIGENGLKELRLLREAIEENNKIQSERNNIFRRYLEKQ